ncbi:MAG: hypothetical protein P8Z78_14925 [Gammaproteobacteria bacterium]
MLNKKALTAITFILAGSIQTSFAADDKTAVRVEGVVITEHDVPAASFCMGGTSNGAYVILRDSDGGKQKTSTDIQLGGYFSFLDVVPGIYDLFIEQTETCQDNKKTQYRAQHIIGVVVEPGKQLNFELRVNEGTGLETIGDPVFEKDDVIFISEKIRILEAQIIELRTMLEASDSLVESANEKTEDE